MQAGSVSFFTLLYLGDTFIESDSQVTEKKVTGVKGLA